MSANRIFLVCSHCKNPEDALLLSERPEGNRTHELSQFTKLTRADAWFEKHAKHGNPDDFQLAFHRPQNWDVSPPAEPVASAVRVAIALNGETEH